MDCIFNELSACPVSTVAEAYSVMTLFVQSTVSAQQFGLNRVRIPQEIGQNLYNLPLTDTYTIGSWVCDERVK